MGRMKGTLKMGKNDEDVVGGGRLKGTLRRGTGMKATSRER